jgi:polysaccharide pyruvyl transferase WcaK-like protein
MFTSIKEWATFYAKTDALVTGSRVHGAILAIAQGNPAIFTAGDLRASEMLNLIGMQAWRQRTLPNGTTVRDAFERAFYHQARLHEKLIHDFAGIEEFRVLA